MGNCISFSISCDKLLSGCQDYVVKKATYKHDLQENLVTLQKNLERVTEKRNDVLRILDIEERQQHIRRLDQVQGWLSRVKAAEDEVDKLKNDGPQEIDKLCLGGFCTSNNLNILKSSNGFGERVTRMLEEVAALKMEGDQFTRVTEKRLEDLPDERPCEIMIGSESTFQEVWRYLVEEQVGIIGLYGMGGVGKTTLLKKINNRFREMPNDFTVIWVTVSRSPQIQNIQNTIGRKIGLFNGSWGEKSIEDKATDILRILNQKKFALLLDDIWDRVDLETIGVPPPDSTNKSKVVFTTRHIGVCGIMRADQDIKVECLRHEDAWELFKSKVGDGTLNSHPEIPELAEIVAEECGGLPLALVSVALAMTRSNTPEEWEHAIGVLKRLAYEFADMEDKVFRLLKFSYDHLPDAIRSCLLYCSLFPENHSISRKELIECWISEGILDDRNGMQNEGYRNINVLVHACLLEEAEDNCVKMHDLIRDMALWIATKVEKENERFFVRTGVELIEIPKIDEWESIRRMSFIENKIESLAMIPTCPRLKTLFLNSNHLKMISGNFFQSMPSLTVLNLSNNPSLTNLPSEISILVSLQHLDLSRTAIKKLPPELESLVELKCLNLEHMSQLQTIPWRLISNFLKLHVLRLWECGSSSLATDDSVLFNGAEFLTEELLCLPNLNMLSITLKNDHAFESFFKSRKLQNCTQSLCLQSLARLNCLKALVTDLKQMDTLKIMDCKCLAELQFDCLGEMARRQKPSSFRSLHTVNINSCSKLRDLTCLVLAPNLKSLVVLSCSSIKDIFCDKKNSDLPEKIKKTIPFAKLEFLELQQLQNLKSIYWNAMPFQHLKKIKVIRCPKLEKLPLDFNSAKEHKIVIEGEQDWWERLQWVNPAIKNAFRPCFTSSW